jgi:PEP-CTERM motif
MTVSRVGILSLAIAVTWTGLCTPSFAKAIKEVGVQVVSNDVLPNPGVPYASLGGQVKWTPPGKAIKEQGVQLTAQDGASPSGQPGGPWSFDTTIFMEYAIDFDVDGEVVRAEGVGTARIAGTAPDGTSLRVFDTEMLQLQLSGTIPTASPTSFMLRESPTLASTGQTTVESLPGGMFHIDSFFDVFTELSLDGGATWHAATAAVPEPSAVFLATLGSLVCAALRRKRSR